MVLFPFRFEYISSDGSNRLGAPNLLYGVGKFHGQLR